jgi:2-polyprenyl-3-methyl-5-hydroxy-6-metoxy-1,4-benzoquinol methylase
MRGMGQHCRVCNSTSSRELFTIERDRFMVCRDCTHVFLDVSYDDDSIKKLYADYGDERAREYFQGIDWETRANIDLFLKRCQSYCLTPHDTLRLLDVGCGTGTLLKGALKLGFSVEGVEICEPLARDTAEQVGCTVHEEVLSRVTFDREQFDVITLYDVIEHLQEPLRDLRVVYDVLKPGGVLFILCPNEGALIRKLSKLIFTLSLSMCVRPVRLLYYQDHLSYFTRKSLLTMVKELGLEVLSLETRNQELSRLALSPLQKSLLRTLFCISGYFSGAGGKFVVYARRPFF